MSHDLPNLRRDGVCGRLRGLVWRKHDRELLLNHLGGYFVSRLELQNTRELPPATEESSKLSELIQSAMRVQSLSYSCYEFHI